MLRMLLADDEYMEREAMKKIVGKRFGQQYEVQTAANGKQAVALAREFEPHLIFMDIKMPGLSGIEAAKEIKKFLPQVLIVFVTAYDYFDYAKQAISLNAEELLLKPVEIEVICELIKKLTEKIKQQLEKSAYTQKIEDRFELISRQLEHELFVLIESIGSTKEQILEHFKLMAISFKEASVVALDFSKFHEDASINALQKTFLKTRFLEKIRHLCQARKIALFPEVSGDLGRMIFVYQEEVLSGEVLRQLIEEAVGMMAIPYELALEEGITEVTELRGALVAASYQLLGVHKKDVYPYELEKTFLESLHRGKLEEAQAILIEITNIFQKQYTYRTVFNRKVIELYTMVKRSFKEKEQVLFRYQDELVERVETREEMLYFFEQQLEVLGQKRGDKNKELIQKVCEYIEANYKEELSLEEVAKYIGFSTFYFSKLMKEYLNMSFVDYLAKVRIEKAKHLFETTPMNIGEVGYEVGYGDANYFTRVFKKVVGVPPSAYKKAGTQKC